MSSSQRAALRTEQTPSVRSSAWDEVANGELAFDFSSRRPAAAPAPGMSRSPKRGVKEAIVRWLEEQL